MFSWAKTWIAAAKFVGNSLENTQVWVFIQ